MVGGAGGGGEGAGSSDTPVTETWGDTCAGSSPAGVAARMRLCQRWRLRLQATASVTAGAGMLQETVKI
jgi:hypothetical protein